MPLSAVAGPSSTGLIGSAAVNTSTTNLLPSDDWPFLYLKTREIPFKPSVTGMMLIATLSDADPADLRAGADRASERDGCSF